MGDTEEKEREKSDSKRKLKRFLAAAHVVCKEFNLSVREVYALNYYEFITYCDYISAYYDSIRR